MHRAPAIAALLSMLWLAGGCATTTQRVVIDCVPEQVRVYVDGRLLEGTRDAIFLRTDEPHKIFVKGPGFEPQLVVLDSVTGPDGAPRLERGEVCIELVPVGQRREIELEVEEP